MSAIARNRCVLAEDDWFLSESLQRAWIKADALRRIFIELGGEVLDLAPQSNGVSAVFRVFGRKARISMAMDEKMRLELERTGLLGRAGAELIARGMGFLFDMSRIEPFATEVDFAELWND